MLRRRTPQEYLAIDERKADRKSEYCNGEILRHVRITRNINGEIYGKLRGSACEVLGSDMRLCTNSATGLYTYPDVIVIRGKPQLLDKHFDASPQSHSNLRSAVSLHVVDAGNIHIEHQTRQRDGAWLIRDTREISGSIAILSIQIELALAAVYSGLDD